MMPLPRLPGKAAYLYLNNPARRNALSLPVLSDLRAQLHRHLTSPTTGRLLLLPPFQPQLLARLEDGADPEVRWLTDAAAWRRERRGLPSVLVLRSQGPVFSSGHDLRELATLPHDRVKETFALCAEVMALLRRSPAPVVCAVQGLATAAGAQLALSADVAIARADTPFCLPGAGIGLPCTSPATALSRRLGAGLAFRMLATGEAVPAAELRGAVDVVTVPEHAEATDTAAAAFEARVAVVVRRLAEGTAGQPQALGKWAYWTQLGISGDGDGYEEAARWAGRVMALHARSQDAREGVDAFLGKRKPVWVT